MDDFVKKRSVVRRKLTIATTLLEAESAPASVSSLATLADVEKLAGQLSELNLQIAVLDEATLETDYAAELVVKTKIAQLNTKFKPCTTITTQSQSSPNASNAAGGNNSSSNSNDYVAMRKLQDIPTFNGDCLKWPTFWDSFSHAVDKATNLSKCKKFTYLRDRLEGEARTAIEGWATSDSNYDAAKQYLTTRFGNEEDQKQALWARLMQIQVVKDTSDVKMLRGLLDVARSTTRSLDSLGVQQSSYSSMFKVLLRQKIPSDLDAKWLLSLDDPDSATLEQMLTFFEKRVRAQEQTNLLTKFSNGHGQDSGRPPGIKRHSPNPNPYNKPPGSGYRPPGHTTMYATPGTATNICIFCEGQHSFWECSLAVPERKAAIFRKRLCYNCLRPGHASSACFSSRCCKICNGRHHSTIHVQDPAGEPSPGTEPTGASGIATSTSSSSPTPTEPSPTDPPVTVKVQFGCHGNSHKTYLPIVKVQVHQWSNQNHESVMVRTLLDSGSTGSFCGKETAKHGTFIRKIDLELATFGGTVRKEVTDVVRLQLVTPTSDVLHIFTIEAIVLQDLGVTQSPPSAELPAVKELCRKYNVQLSDDDNPYPQNSTIDLLLGSDCLGQVLTGARLVLGGGAIAIKSIFGWALQGPVLATTGRHIQVSHVNVTDSLSLNREQLEDKVTSFWTLEDVPSFSQLDVELDAFSDNITYDSTTRRYTVGLLWKGPERPTPNRGHCLKLFDSHKARAQRNGYWDKFVDVINEYCAFGAIEVDPEADLDSGYFLPCHGVYREGHETHPVRAVMNASSKRHDSLSLNDCLQTGVNLLPHVSSVITNFRAKLHPVTGDIQKAFFNISVREQDRQYLRLIWETPKRMSRVPFGVNCSPYLLQATIHHHLRNQLASGDLTLQLYITLLDSLYMDDVISSFDTAAELENFMSTSIAVFDLASMTLHKWKTQSNDPTSADRYTTVLGVRWDRYEDQLYFPSPVVTNVSTKRLYLSVLASVFDPVGLLAPVTVQGKMILQKIWIQELGWDDVLPDSLQAVVDDWCSAIQSVDTVMFPRHVLMTDPYDLHVFGDASQAAIGCAAYIVNGKNSNLVFARTKVAPLKTIDLPRLELAAAVLATKLAVYIKSTLSTPPSRTYLWTDSEVTLAWIVNKQQRQWKTFVANRVGYISGHTGLEDWKKVPGPDNPSDLASRGTLDVANLTHPLWMHGPSWLVDPSSWPEQPSHLQTEREAKANVNFNAQVDVELDPDLFSHISSWSKMIRVIVIIKRMEIPPNERPRGVYSYEERCEAENTLIRYIQSCSFADELKALRKEEKIKDKVRKSRLLPLDPFLDKDGIIRLTGRTGNADIPFSAKRPAILPGEHRYAELLVRETHQKLMHAGVNTTINVIRRKFWITKGPRLCRLVRQRCVTCKRHDNHMPQINPPYAQLPKDRVNLTRPFAASGVDYAGPFKVKSETKPGEIQMVYILLFVCASTRAVALYLTDSQTTPEFMITFRKFCAEYGPPQLVRSDNAKTFKKAAASLKIKWLFNPPRAPWWGGFYERMVQSTKRPLKKVIGAALVTRKELECLLVELQTVVNLRPLTQPQTDAEDANPITPAGLMGKTFTDEPALELTARDMNRRQRYLARISQNLRKRWKSEYLCKLLVSKTSHNNLAPPRVGDIVLVHDDAKPRSRWPLARVIETLPGPDGIVRLVKLVNATGFEFHRAVQRLLPLEVDLPAPDDADNGSEHDNDADIDVPDKDNDNQTNKAQPALGRKDQDQPAPPVPDTNHELVTRRGREIKLPARLKD